MAAMSLDMTDKDYCGEKVASTLLEFTDRIVEKDFTTLEAGQLALMLYIGVMHDLGIDEDGAVDLLRESYPNWEEFDER